MANRKAPPPPPPAPGNAPPQGAPRTALQKDVEKESLERAKSEVASDEYDVQG